MFNRTCSSCGNPLPPGATDCRACGSILIGHDGQRALDGARSFLRDSASSRAYSDTDSISLADSIREERARSARHVFEMAQADAIAQQAKELESPAYQARRFYLALEEWINEARAGIAETEEVVALLLTPAGKAMQIVSIGYYPPAMLTLNCYSDEGNTRVFAHVGTIQVLLRKVQKTPDDEPRKIGFVGGKDPITKQPEVAPLIETEDGGE